VDDIIEAIGIDLVETLFAAFGYVQVYIPKEPHRAKKIISIIGLENYQLLASIAGGRCIFLQTKARTGANSPVNHSLGIRAHLDKLRRLRG